MKIRFTKLRLKSPGYGGKVFSEDAEGNLVKDTVGHLNKAEATVMEVSDLAGFVDVWDSLEAGREVLAYGVPALDADGPITVLSEDRYNRRKDKTNCIRRAEEHFKWPDGPGLIFWDYDPRGGHEALSTAEIVKVLRDTAPLLEGVDLATGVSSSSYIYKDGVEVQGLRGQRIFAVAQDATDIPRAMEAFIGRLWIAGYGHILVSGSGGKLERCIIDPTVFQASRLDYAGGAICKGGFEQRRPAPEVIAGWEEAIDTRKVFPDLTPDEQREYQRLVSEAKEEVREEAEATFEKWLLDRAADALGEGATQDEIAALADVRRSDLRGVAEGESTTLDAELMLHLTSGELVSVRDVLMRPRDFDKAKTADPIEPEYGGGRQVGILYPRNRRLVAQSHGMQINYVLGTNEQYAEIQSERKKDWLNIVARLERARNILKHADDVGLVWDIPEARERLEEVAREQKVLTKLKQRLNAPVAQVEAVAPTDSRIRVFATDPNAMNDYVHDIEAELAAQRKAFVYGGVPVMLREMPATHVREPVAGPDGQLLRDEDGSLITRPKTLTRPDVIKAGDAVSLTLTVAGFFATRRDGGIIPKAPPEGYSSVFTSAIGPNLPPLAGVSQHPVWHGGALVSGNGYHEPTGLMLATGHLQIEEWSDPAAALNFLRDEWLVDFPFATDDDLIGALAIPLTLLTARSELSEELGPPGFTVTAPNAGTGKTLLVSALVSAVSGRMPGVAPMPEDNEAFEKLITSAVMSGNGDLIFDNVKSGSTIGNRMPGLAQLLTSNVWTSRVLGASKMYEGPSLLTLIMTGNNILVSGDIASRVRDVRLVAPIGQNLAQRKFRHANILKWTRKNRGKILGALGAILRHKGKVETAGRFPKWNAVVAAPLVDLVGSDTFFDPWIQAAEDDGAGFAFKDVETLINVIANMSVEEQFWTAQEILDRVDDGILIAALPSDSNGFTSLDTRTLSATLRRHQDVTVDGLVVLRVKHMNLGERTGRKKRWVFQTQLLEGITPAEKEKQDRARLAELVKGKGSGRYLPL